MPRLIEIRHGKDLPPVLTVGVGDLLVVGATGGRVRSGAEVVRILGPFRPGALDGDGRVIAPMGAPNAVSFLALAPGRAEVDVVCGVPQGSPQTISLEIVVEP